MKSIIIATKSNAHNEWLAFSSWYSIHRNAPDVKVGVIFPRENKSHQFNWLRKCQVPFIAYNEEWPQERAVLWMNNRLECEPITVISDTIMMIRSDGFNSEIIPVPMDNPNPAQFVDVNSEKFNLSEWMEKEKSHPFHRTAQLMSKNRTVNEQRVISLWRQMGPTFDFINR